jgi:hypothetical protein
MTRVIAFVLAAGLLGGCHLSLWTWSSGSGTHELTVPPGAAATPEPTPESRY